MDEIYQDNNSRYKTGRNSNKLKSKSKTTFMPEILKCFIGIKRLFIWLFSKICFYLSKFSMITQIVLILIPSSIFCVFLILQVHFFLLFLILLQY